MILKVHQSNYRIVGFTESVAVRELATSGRPWSSTSAPGCSTRPRRGSAGRRRAWLRGEPGGAPDARRRRRLVTFSGDKLLGGPQAGVIAGPGRPGRRLRARHPLARALRPGGLVLGRAAGDRAGLPAQRRRRHPVLADGDRAGRRCCAPEPRRIGARRGRRLRVGCRCRLAARPRTAVGRRRPRRRPHRRPSAPTTRRSSPGSATGARSSTCARSTRPTIRRSPRRWRACSRAPRATSTTASRRSSRALTGIDPDRWAEEKARGLTIDLGFAWCTLPRRGRRRLRRRSRPRPVHQQHARRRRRRRRLPLRRRRDRRAGSRSPRSTCGSSNCWAFDAGVIALTMAALVDDERLGAARALEVADRVAGTVPGRAPRSWRSTRRRGVGIDAVATPRSTRASPARRRRDDRDRPRLWVDRAFAARGAGTVVTGTLTGGRARRR